MSSARWVSPSSPSTDGSGRVTGRRHRYHPPVSPFDTPTGIAALPRFALIDGPSPLQRLPRFSAALGGTVDVWIKREDLLPLAFGGNKLRNLEFLVGEALAEGADTLVTSGRRWSNHCRLTAAAGAKAGLAVHLVLTGPPASTSLDRTKSWTHCSAPRSTSPRPMSAPIARPS